MYNLQIYYEDKNFNHIIFTNIIKDLHLINKVVQYIKIFDVNFIFVSIKTESLYEYDKLQNLLTILNFKYVYFNNLL